MIGSLGSSPPTAFSFIVRARAVMPLLPYMYSRNSLSTKSWQSRSKQFRHRSLTVVNYAPCASAFRRLIHLIDSSKSYQFHSGSSKL
jgi:hypothetical protein